MTRLWRTAAAVTIAAAALGAGIWGQQRWQQSQDAHQAVSDLRQLTLPDPHGRPQSMAAWQGRVLVVNFWATWCEPCREEIPALLRTRAKHAANGVEIVGIAVDSAAKVRDFAAELNMTYPLMVGGLETIDLTRRLGNKIGALPYTLIVDRAGRLAFARLGGVTDSQLDAALAPLLGTAAENRSNSWIRWTNEDKAAENRPLWQRDNPAAKAAASSSFTGPT